MSEATESAEIDTSATFSRERVLTIVLMIATAIVFYLCWLIAQPFLPSIAWALALSIVGMPMHRWIRKRIKQPSLAAGLSVLAIAIVIVAPAFFVAQQVVVQAVEGSDVLRREIETGEFRKQLMSNPQLAKIVQFAETNVDLKGSLEKVIGSLSGFASSIVTGSISAIVELLIIFFCLFFFFRDRDKV
ncbi:MAG: AI-2E family transporter, partial [bacterium]|nr:AI-2E family transporter [Candidatus Kapabacteria bacterium]